MTIGATEDRMLAQAAGSYRERPVEGALQDHFTCVWVHQLPKPEVQPVVVVPDGCIDLEWIDGALRIAGPDRAPKMYCENRWHVPIRPVQYRPVVPSSRPIW